MSAIFCLVSGIENTGCRWRTSGHCFGARFIERQSEFDVSMAKKIAFVLFRNMIRIGTGVYINDPMTGLQGLNWKTVLFYSKFEHFDDKYPDANMIM